MNPYKIQTEEMALSKRREQLEIDLYEVNGEDEAAVLSTEIRLIDKQLNILRLELFKMDQARRSQKEIVYDDSY
jgi:hypothetical protein